MKQIIIPILSLYLLVQTHGVHAQFDTLHTHPVNDSIFSALALTDELSSQFLDLRAFASDTDSVNLVGSTWYWFYLEFPSPAVTFSSADGLRELLVFGPYPEDFTTMADSISSGAFAPLYTFMLEPGDPVAPSFTIPPLETEGLYAIKNMTYLKVTQLNITPEDSLAGRTNNLRVENRPRTLCTECIDGDMPEAGTYLVSAWVSMDNAAAGTTSYTGPQITIATTSGATTITPANSDPETFIIDGWQLIEGAFTMPSGNSTFTLTLECTSGTCYFDDVRLLPFNASMKTYVYDPFTLRLSAELDERHYATLYEYDDEGKLKRVKKETERGIMTIQETTTSIVKTHN